MADNNPLPNRTGGISLGMAIAAALAAIALPSIATRSLDLSIQRLYVFGYMAWWAVAFVLGIIGRGSVAGKIALVILVLLGVAFTWVANHPPPPRYQ